MSQASSTGKDGDQWLPHRIAVPSAAPGLPVLIRQVAASDRPALAEMLARYSDQTRERRFHKYVRCFPEAYLAQALAGRATHFSILAQAGQAVVALSGVATGRGSAELAVLVEDSWQRLGVGARQAVSRSTRHHVIAYRPRHRAAPARARRRPGMSCLPGG